jgi:Xaa-Pro aminopeptidase
VFWESEEVPLLDDREFAKRRKGFRDLMNDEGLDGILVTGLSDVRYLCGFSGSSGICILLRDRGYFLTDFRYRDQSEFEVKGLRAVVYKASADEAVADILGGYDGLRLGFDPSAITYAGVLALRRKMRVIAHIVPLKGSLAALRARKSRSELILIRMGISLAEKAFLMALEEVRSGGTESGFAASIDRAARGMGAEGPAFETIVAGGKNGALVHARPSRRKLAGAVVVDWGIAYEGYKTDTTRTVVFGRVAPELRRAHRLVLDAQESAFERIRPGARARDVDGAARELIEKAGYGDAFGHSLGHGVGLEVHERPFVGKNSREVLEEGMVITVEPGIYLSGVGGVRVEDMVLVKRSGPELLTSLPRSMDTGDYP